jgi:hypothetical protein
VIVKILRCLESSICRVPVMPLQVCVMLLRKSRSKTVEVRGIPPLRRKRARMGHPAEFGDLLGEQG